MISPIHCLFKKAAAATAIFVAPILSLPGPLRASSPLREEQGAALAIADVEPGNFDAAVVRSDARMVFIVFYSSQDLMCRMRARDIQDYADCLPKTVDIYKVDVTNFDQSEYRGHVLPYLAKKCPALPTVMMINESGDISLGTFSDVPGTGFESLNFRPEKYFLPIGQLMAPGRISP